jgi:long-chain acyl-CoA synthetase
VREFSVPPVVAISDATNLTDAVWDNAERVSAHAPVRPPAGTGWKDVTCAEFRDEVTALAPAASSRPASHPASGSR